MTLAWTGKTELAIERAERAIRLNPFDSYNFRSHHALAITYFHLRQYAAAVDAARNAVNSNPSFSIARAVLAAALLRAGRMEEAMAAGRDVLECEPTLKVRTLSFFLIEAAVFEPFADAWREIGLPE